MKEWIDALKKGTALRFLDAVEPPPGMQGPRVRGIFGTSDDGTWLLLDALDVCLCDAELGRWRVLARGPHFATAACFAGGFVVVAWKAGSLTAVDLEGNVVWSEKAAPGALGDVRPTEHVIRQLRVNEEGEIVVAYTLGCVRWLDPKTGTELRRMALDKRTGTLRAFDGETGESDGPEYEAVFHEEIVGFDPSGRHALGWLPTLYNGPHRPGDLRLRDFASGACTTVKENILRPSTMRLGPGARWAIAWGGWAAIDLWNIAEGRHLGFRPVMKTAGSTHWGPSAALSPNGRHWVSAVEQQICLWEMAAESPIDRIEMPIYPSIEGPMSFSPDGRSLYFCLEGRAVRMAVEIV